MKLGHRIQDWWYERQRRKDVEILWPLLKKRGRDLNAAKTAFAIHAFKDPAWLHLGEERVKRIIDAFE